MILSDKGQTHLFGIVNLNVRVNYLPKPFIDQICSGSTCKGGLKAEIISGDKSALSIQVEFILGTSYSFGIKFIYGKEPIGIFTARISIDPKYLSYFTGVDASSSIDVNIDPAFLAVYDQP